MSAIGGMLSGPRIFNFKAWGLHVSDLRTSLLSARYLAFELEDDNLRGCRPSLLGLRLVVDRGEAPYDKIKMMRNLIRLEELVLVTQQHGGNTNVCGVTFASYACHKRR